VGWNLRRVLTPRERCHPQWWRAQFGVVTRLQLLAAGVSSKGISLRVRDGRLHRLHPGVYAVGHAVLVPRGRMLAAVLSCGPEAALSYTSATALHDIREEGPRTHVSVPRAGPHSRPGIIVHRSRRLDPKDVTRVTTIARTILDLAEVLNARQVTALNHADALGVFDLTDLEATIVRNPGRRTTALREALGAEAPSRRELQRRFLRLCRRHGLPEPSRRRRSARTAQTSSGLPPGSSSRPTAEPTTSAAPPSSVTGSGISTSPHSGSRHSA
jgi:hypothetical protein